MGVLRGYSLKWYAFRPNKGMTQPSADVVWPKEVLADLVSGPLTWLASEILERLPDLGDEEFISWLPILGRFSTALREVGSFRAATLAQTLKTAVELFHLEGRKAQALEALGRIDAKELELAADMIAAGSPLGFSKPTLSHLIDALREALDAPAWKGAGLAETLERLPDPVPAESEAGRHLLEHDRAHQELDRAGILYIAFDPAVVSKKRVMDILEALNELYITIGGSELIIAEDEVGRAQTAAAVKV